MKIQETLRRDGLRIISCKIPSKRVKVYIKVNVGSMHDPTGKEGIFHFFEHMLFRGTKTRSAESITALINAHLLDSNAYTDRTHTAYYGEAVYTKFRILAELLCDMFANATLPPKELQIEREVVLNEMAIHNDDDYWIAMNALSPLLWKKNPLKTFYNETTNSIKSITRNDLLAERERWYLPSNAVIIAAGHVDHNELVEIVNSIIPHTPDKARHPQWDWIDEYYALPSSPLVTIEEPGRQKATILLGCKFPVYGTVDEIMTSKLLSESLSSVFRDELREKRGLVYGVSAGVSTEPEVGGHFLIHTETLPASIQEVRDLILETISRPITKEYLQQTKDKMQDVLILATESPGQCVHIIENNLWRVGPAEELMKFVSKMRGALRRVTLDNINQMRQLVLDPKRFATAIVKS